MAQNITPFLWFDGNAEEAVNYYVSIFPNSRILSLSRYGEGAPVPAGTVMTAAFELDGLNFIALNGGPMFKFTEAVSFVVTRDTQAELDELWNKLTDGGEEQPCGWLKDRFGLSWQVVPSILGQLLSDPNPAKAQSVAGAMMQMKKIDIQALKDARERA